MKNESYRDFLLAQRERDVRRLEAAKEELQNAENHLRSTEAAIRELKK